MLFIPDVTISILSTHYESTVSICDVSYGFHTSTLMSILNT